MDSLGIPAGSGSWLTGLSWDGSELWLADEATSIIYKLDTQGNNYNFYLAPASSPRGLTFDGNYLWCVANDYIYNLKPLIPAVLNVKIHDIDTTAFPEIKSYVSVMDQSGEPVTNLMEENFRITENNAIQTPIQISLIDSTQQVNFSIVMDYSGSMFNSGAIDDMKNAAHTFVNLMHVNDQGAVFKFNSNVHKIQSLTSDTSLLHQAINTPIQGSGTALYDAIWESVTELNTAFGTRAGIVMTDGNDNNSFHNLEDVVIYADTNDVSVYTIGLGGDFDENILKKIADSTGGQFYPAPNSSQLDSIYKTISKALYSQYALSYTTTNANFDGTYREVIISADYNSISGRDTTHYWAPRSDSIMVLISDSLSGQFGDTVNVPIMVSDLTDAEISAITLTILYDPGILTAFDVTTDSTIAASWGKPTKNLLSGKIKIAMAGSSALSGKGPLVKIIFLVIGSSGQATSLHFEKAKFNEGFPPAKTIDGFFKVIGFSLSGEVRYYPNLDSLTRANFDYLFVTKSDFDSLFSSINKVIDSVEINLLIKDKLIMTTLTDSNGFYEFPQVPETTIVINPNIVDRINKSITSYDASLVLRYVVDLIPFSPYQMISADVTGNDEVSALDASEILKRNVGNTDKFPVGADWTFVPHDFLINSKNWYQAPRTRNYKIIDQTKTEENLYGIVYGDVSGNWEDSKKILAKNKINYLVNSQLIFDDVIELSENKVILAIGMKEISDIYSFSLTLKYDPEILKIINVSNTEQTQDYSLIYNTEGLYLNIAAAGTKAINGGGSLVNIEFELSKTATYSADNSLLITSFSLNEIQATNLNKEISLNTVPALPTEYAISQNYPNPFNLQTMIKYQLPEKAHVKIELFNLLGQRVRTLFNEEIKAGYHQVSWDGLDDFQNTAASGVYIFRLQANQFVSNRKLVILR